MINKLEVIQERLNNIQFHIDHVNRVLVNPESYPTPLNKTLVDLNGSLLKLMSQKEALESESIALTNQG